MSEPLNPRLHRALVKKFRTVIISNEGDRYIGTQQESSYRRGRIQNPPLYAGEYYRVSCPFCDDTRQRLYINHMFNVVAEGGDDHLYLAHCFNGECIDCRSVQTRLVEIIFPFGYRSRQRLVMQQPRAVESVQALDQIVTLPPSAPLQDPMSERAWEYLANRGFDPQEISDRWGVTYCLIAPNVSPRVHSRIIIPIHHYQVGLGSSVAIRLAGWQAREIHSAGSSCKYLSMAGMRKSHLLYGLPSAVTTTGPIVVVEGPTDVWRLGTNAVALFGKSISPHQIALLNSHLGNRPLVIALDRDAQGEAGRMLSLIRESRSSWRDRQPVVLCAPPAGAKDFGEITREAAWAAVHASICQQG